MTYNAKEAIVPNVVNEEHLDASEVIHKLMEDRIGFSIHYVAFATDAARLAVITVKESVNNSQLRTLTDVGANMQPDGVFHILCSF